MALNDGVPYPEEDRGKIHDLFISLPTYKDGYVYTSDIPNILKAIKYERTEEQMKAYATYWDEVLGGRADEELFTAVILNLHKTNLYARQLTNQADKNKDGTIQREEFQQILKVLVVHDPGLTGKTFEDFVQEADTNKDGVVDVEECIKWIEKNAKH